MAGLLNGGGNTLKTPKYTEINLQTSAQGLPIPIVYGQNRIGTNVIWYNGFNARTTKVAGKGGVLGGGGKTYYYSADVILSLCEGPIQSVPRVWAGTTITTFQALGFSLFLGTKTQTPWSFVQANYPAQALSYAQTAYLAAANYQLGTSPDLPNHNFEVVGFLSGTVTGIPDANFSDIIYDFLTNPQYSIGMNTASLNAADLVNYKNYSGAAGIFGSPALINQEQANQTVKRWAQLTNTWIFWSGNNLRFIPLGDTALSAYGYTYTPQLTPIYNLTYDDFVTTQPGEPPVQVDFVDPADGFDRVQLNMLDRSNYYNNTPILWEDQTTVDELGQLQANVISATELCQQAYAQAAAALIGKRSVYVNRTYTFKVSRRFIFIEPGDIYTLTDPNIGLSLFQVRITSVKSGTDRILTVTAENLPQGVGTTAAYSLQAAGAQPAYDSGVAPGNANAPAIFEPNAALTGGSPQVWIGASGGPNWGGAEVLLSFDGVNYDNVGTIGAGLLQGTLISSLASHADPDMADVLSVDLSESDGVMPSTATQADADALRTLILVDSEVMSYGTAAPGTLNAYSSNLTYLRRGQYGTSIASHAAGAPFARLDQNIILTYGLPEQYVGSTLSIKLASFNIFGGELQSASTLSAYTYVPVGTAYALGAPGTPVITPSRTTQPDGTTILTLTGTWSASAGPLLGSYEAQWSTNGGTSWTNDTTVGPGAGGVVLAPAVPSTSYLLRVRAISQNGSAVSAWSVSASTGSGSLLGSVPDAPTGIAASALAGGALVTWTPSDSASTRGYQVSYGTTNVFASATLYPVSASGSGLTVTGLAAGTLYYFWVQAFNGAGASSPDGPASATPSASGGAGAYQQGTVVGSGTLTIGSELSMIGSTNPTLAFGGVVALEGTSSLGGFVTLEVGAGLTASLAGGTLSLTGTSAGVTLENNGGLVGAFATLNMEGAVAASPASYPTYKYFKGVFSISGSSPYACVAIAEMEFFNSTGGMISTSGGTASASSTYSSQLPSYAFDGNMATYWVSGLGTDPTPTLEFAFAGTQTVASVTFYPRDDAYADEGPGAVEIYGSPDGVTWTALTGLISFGAWTAGVGQSVSLSASGAANVYAFGAVPYSVASGTTFQTEALTQNLFHLNIVNSGVIVNNGILVGL